MYRLSFFKEKKRFLKNLWKNFAAKEINLAKDLCFSNCLEYAAVCDNDEC